MVHPESSKVIGLLLPRKDDSAVKAVARTKMEQHANFLLGQVEAIEAANSNNNNKKYCRIVQAQPLLEDVQASCESFWMVTDARMIPTGMDNTATSLLSEVDTRSSSSSSSVDESCMQWEEKEKLTTDASSMEKPLSHHFLQPPVTPPPKPRDSTALVDGLSCYCNDSDDDDRNRAIISATSTANTNRRSRRHLEDVEAENRALRESVQQCVQAVRSIQTNAQLKIAHLERQVAYLRQQLANDQQRTVTRGEECPLKRPLRLEGGNAATTTAAKAEPTTAPVTRPTYQSSARQLLDNLRPATQQREKSAVPLFLHRQQSQQSVASSRNSVPKSCATRCLPSRSSLTKGLPRKQEKNSRSTTRTSPTSAITSMLSVDAVTTILPPPPWSTDFCSTP